MTYDRFVKRVQSLGSLPSLGAAIAAIHATLTTLGERLHGNEGRQLASQLPREIGTFVGSPTASRFSLADFYARVASRAGIRSTEAEIQARVVMRVLAEAISPGEMEDVLAQLPAEYDELFFFEEDGPEVGHNGNAFSDMRVSELMTSDVQTVSPATSVAEAARKMRDFDCGSLPVIDEGRRPIGIITDRDIAISVAARSLEADQVPVGKCMTDRVATCSTDETVTQCLERMGRNQVRRMPVVNNAGRLVGIISQADLARHADAHPGSGERRSVASTVSEISEPGRPPC
jgi:CBS domain-containing protein/uncharacterized protein (DUF2267 family)